jgi:hypothetical protein
MRLRRNEFCPIHRSLFCCGREQARKERRLRLGVQRIEDPHHPRGYRELRSPAEMRKLLNRKIVEQGSKAGNVQSATRNSRITVTSSRTTESRREWEEPGETITRATSGLRIGGAIREKDQSERVTESGLCVLAGS